MNRSYRSIWNDKTGTFVAVSEDARSAGKNSSSSVSASISSGALVTTITQLTQNVAINWQSTGTGLIDFESSGGALATTGTLTTADNITLIGSAGVTVNHALTSSSGTGTAVVVKAGNGIAAGTATGGDKASPKQGAGCMLWPHVFR